MLIFSRVQSLLFRSCEPTFLLIVSLAPFSFRCFYRHFISALLLHRIIYRYIQICITNTPVFLFFALSAVQQRTAVFSLSFSFFHFLATAFCSINVGLACGRNNVSVLWSSFRRVVCYFFLSNIKKLMYLFIILVSTYVI